MGTAAATVVIRWRRRKRKGMASGIEVIVGNKKMDFGRLPGGGRCDGVGEEGCVKAVK
ncbi:hypothetical protein HPP92_005731 [Vanilla planifolia]|uniref:Uncharacterized protein n=1 Tax=Vanilla planifolia TaxID=51239 RepID=A0A835VDG9_VANPL|nr:hypothetical protein HPP92_005731 [Vanilla planifolia]